MDRLSFGIILPYPHESFAKWAAQWWFNHLTSAQMRGNLCLIETNRWLANNFMEVSTSNANLVTEKNVFSP
jgi:hypothetical protein